MATTSATLTPDPHWDDRLDTVVEWLELDHRHDLPPAPRLFGYVEDRLFVCIELRPFPPDGVRGPFTEAMAALFGIGCDGIVAAMPGRAWSLDDPIVPVSDDGDLRQRVVVVASARRGDPPDTSMLPFDESPAGLRWHDRIDTGARDDWMVGALRVTVEHPSGVTIEEATAQLVRCVGLGHTVVMADGRVA